MQHLLATGEITWFGGHTELEVLDSWRGQVKARYLTPEYKYCRVAGLSGRKVVTNARHLGRPFFGFGTKSDHEARLAQGLATHDEVRDVLRAALDNPGLGQVVADYLSRNFRAVIVDEVFDGNGLDLAIVEVASKAGIPTTIIGDPWQALYEFRGAEPELVPEFVTRLDFKPLKVAKSFRFQTDEMKTLARDLRAGVPVALSAGSVADTDVVMASWWQTLWDTSDVVLPLQFGQINNQTDAALALLLQPLVVARFGLLARAAPEAAVVLNLTAEFVRTELPEALLPVLDRLGDGAEADASAALSLLRSTLRDLGGRKIPSLKPDDEAGRVAALQALSRRLKRDRLVPGMTVHQAKGREWDFVGVRLTPAQVGRLASGLEQKRPGDRELYVALTRAKRHVRAV